MKVFGACGATLKIKQLKHSTVSWYSGICVELANVRVIKRKKQFLYMLVKCKQVCLRAYEIVE